MIRCIVINIEQSLLLQVTPHFYLSSMVAGYLRKEVDLEEFTRCNDGLVVVDNTFSELFFLEAIIILAGILHEVVR